jgi:glycosyltransferase involved in cell wall biosynthesis/Mrp family chromosome partitioning ATPase
MPTEIVKYGYLVYFSIQNKQCELLVKLRFKMADSSYLGNKMVQLGYLSEGKLFERLKEQASRNNNGENILLGDLIVQEGELSREQLNTILDIHNLDQLRLSDDAVRLAARLRASFETAGSIIMFTGISEDHGAVEVASQVAHAMALTQGSGKVLLIDANCRNPQLHNNFAIKNKNGLSDVVAAKITIDEAIRPTFVAGLFLLPAGETDAHVIAQSFSRGGQKLFDELGHQYEGVIISAPEFLDYSESSLLASHVNQVVGVGAKGLLRQSNIDNMNKSIDGLDSTLAGIILSTASSVNAKAPYEKINVVHLLHTIDFGGVETIVLNWLHSLNPKELDVQLVCFSNPDNSEKLFIKAAEKAGFSVKTIPWHRGKPIFSASRRLNKILKECNVDIIHTHNTYADIVGLLSAKRLGIKCVSSLYVWSDFGWKRNLLQWINQKVLKRFDLITSQCMTTMENTWKRGIDRSRVRVLPAGMAPIEKQLSAEERKDIRAKYSVDEDHTVLINVSRFYPEKGHDILLHNFKKLHSLFPSLRLWLPGRGPLEENIKSLCNELHLDEVVTFIGFTNEIDNLLQAADIQVHPSHAEGVPMAIVSGMANGLPIVASSVGGISEVIRDDVTGILVPAAGTSRFNDLFIKSVSRIIENPKFAKSLGNRARDFIEQDYSLDKSARTLKAMYRSLLEE